MAVIAELLPPAQPPLGGRAPVPRGPLNAPQRRLRPRGAAAPGVVRARVRSVAAASRSRSSASAISSVGGSGKTPVVAALARLLLATGERPAILSRGYARRDAVDGVLVVSDGARGARAGGAVRRRAADAGAHAARRAGAGLPRSLSGRRAGRAPVRRHRRSCSTTGSSICSSRATSTCCWCRPRTCASELLPTGGCASRSSAARAADAVLVPGSVDEAAPVAARSASPRCSRSATEFGTPRLVRPFGDPVPDGAFGTSRRVVAVAGIARPERFFAAVGRSAGRSPQPMVFRDHHWFTRRTWTRIHARGAGRTAPAA